MADVFYSVSWMGKEDGEIVTYNGGTYTIGTDAFGDYNRAYQAGDVVLCDFFLDGTWIAADYEEGGIVTVTLPGGGEAEAKLGVNAYLLPENTAAKDQEAVTWAAGQARAKGSAVYVNGGSLFYPGAAGSGSLYTNGAKVYISNSYVQRITNGKSSGAPAATPETCLLAGARVDLLYAGNGTNEYAYVYVGKDGYAATISPAYSGSFKTLDVVIDGGSFGSYTGNNIVISDELNITVKNGVSSGNIKLAGEGGYAVFNGFTADVNITVEDSTLGTFDVAGRGDGVAWHSFGMRVGNVNISLKDSTIANIISVNHQNNDLIWSAESYTVTLDHSTVSNILDPGNRKLTSGAAGTLNALKLAYNGGTAFITGGTYCSAPGTPTDVAVDTTWENGVYHYLGMGGTSGSKPKVTKNADGSLTVTNAIFYNADAEAGKQYITGGTATLSGGTQALVTLRVVGNKESYAKTLGCIEAITIDATATLSLGSNVDAGVAITVDATDFTLVGASKVVLTTTGSISTNDFTVLENGVKSEKYVLNNTGKTLELVEKPTVYSVKWADLDDGEKITYNGANYTIGVDAFGNYAKAKAVSANITICDRYYDPKWKDAAIGDTFDIELDGETATLTVGTEALKTFDAMLSAASVDAAAIESNNTRTFSSRVAIDLAGKTLILRNSQAPTAAWNHGMGLKDCSGTVIFTDGSTFSKFNGYGDYTQTDQTTTFIVTNGAYIGALEGRIASSDTYTVAEDGRIVWDGAAAHGTANFVVCDGGSVGELTMGSYGATAKGDFYATVENASIGIFYGSGYNNGAYIQGNEYVTLTNANILTKFDALQSTDSMKNGAEYFSITVTGGTSVIAAFEDMSNAAVSGTNITVTAQDRSYLLVQSNFTLKSNATITIDVTGFAFADDEESVTVLHSTGGSITSYSVNTTGVADTDFDLSVTDKDITLKKKSAYFSSAWVGLEDDTVVQTPGGTGTIGYDAFVDYAVAKSAAEAKGWNLKSADRYYSAEWDGLEAGTPVTIINASGTINTTIGDAAIPAYATLDGAKSAVTSTSNTTLAIVGGTAALGGRTTWYGIRNTILTNGSIVKSGSFDGGVVTVMAGTQDAAYEATFTVGEGGYLANIGITGNDAKVSTFKKLTYNAQDGGRIGTIYIVGYNKGIKGDLEINAKGGIIGTVQTAISSATIEGNVNFNVSDGGVINALYFQPATNSTTTLKAGSSINVTLDGGTVGSLASDSTARILTKEEGATVNVLVKGTATNTIGAWDNTYVDTLTINVGATLALGGEIAYTGTITIDASTCDYSEAQYLLMTGFTGENTITVVNDDPTKDYKIVTDSGKVFYQLKPAYFSTLWESKEEGETVTLGKKTLTIGTDAFGTYSEVPEMKRPVTTSADTYLNSNYTAESTIVLDGGYTTTLGVDAFNTITGAFSRAQGDAKGGKLFVTGGSFTALENMNVENIEITDVDITNSVTLVSGAALAKIDAKVDNARNMNYLYIVTGASTVAGNVNAEISNVTDIRNACYAVTGTTVVEGDLTLNISDSKFIKGVYAIETNAEVKGDVQVFLENTKVYRKGLMIRGKADRTAEVTILGESAVSTFLGFTQVAVAGGAVLRIEAGDGEWGTDYYTALNDVINDGTIYFNHEIAQNTYMTVGNISGSGAVESEAGNYIFAKDGVTYAAAIQDRVLINADWSEKELLDTITVAGVNYIYGVSAFADKASAAGVTGNDTLFVLFGQKIEGNAYGENGKLGFAGGTVTGSAIAGGNATGDITTDSELVVLNVSDAPGSYGTFIGGYKIDGNATVSANSAIKESGAGFLTGTALVGSSYITGNAAVTMENSTSTVSVASGSFSNSLIGGALVNGAEASVEGTLNTNVTLAGGTVKALGGGCYLQNGGSAKVSGTSNMTISGGVVVGHVFGGSFANKQEYATIESLEWSGDINVTIDTTKSSVVIGGNLVAGNYGKGKVSGSTTLTFKGSGANLTIDGHITGDCSGGTDSPDGKFVRDTRTLAFDGFNGSLGTADKKVTGFDAVTLKNGEVTIAGYGKLASVNDWSITDGTLDWTKGANDFDSDKLTLVHTGALDNEWTVFRLAEGLTTDWDCFKTDETIAGANISLSINGKAGVALWSDGEDAYVATLGDADYKFYKDENALKVAKLALA